MKVLDFAPFVVCKSENSSYQTVSAYICMENPEIPGRIQMERFIPVEIFRKKVILFEVLPFSRFYRNDRNFLYQASCREKAKKLPVFCKWHNSTPFLFSVPKKKYQYHLTEIFDRNFHTNGKRSVIQHNMHVTMSDFVPFTIRK